MPENRYSREVCNDNHYEEQTTMVLVTPSQCQAGDANAVCSPQLYSDLRATMCSALLAHMAR